MSDLYKIKYSVSTAENGKSKTFTVEWTIPKFREVIKINFGHKSIIRTSKADFEDDADEDTKFLFRMDFFGRNADLIRIYYTAPTSTCVKYNLTTASGRECGRKEYYMVQANKSRFLTELFNEKISNCVTAGDFYLCLKFTINKEIKVEPSFEPKAELNHDLENMLKNSIFSDVIIKSAEGVKFQTHKVVLAARSTVFKAHFEHRSDQTNVITTSFEAKVLKELLQYIYTDNTPKVDEMPDKLLEVAHHYRLSRLKQLCEKALFQKLTVDNAIETFKIANLYSANKLKKMILDFIRNGRAKQVIETQGWMDLQEGPVTKAIFEHFVKNCLDD